MRSSENYATENLDQSICSKTSDESFLSKRESSKLEFYKKINEMEHPRHLNAIELDTQSYAPEPMGNIGECLSTIGTSLRVKGMVRTFSDDFLKYFFLKK